MNSTVQLTPTYHGFISSTYDALVLFEACLSGQINHVARRPHDREREHVIKSGNIFIYEEHSSGIKRWTDGVSWSPSRILGNFLIYRQLVKPFGPGEKKKALKKAKGPTGVTKNTQTNTRAKNSVHQMFGNPAASAAFGQDGQINVDVERSLIGSLVDSYDFMDDGLVKKTISVTIGEVTHHLVSYYTMADAVITNKFIIPSKDPRFQNIQIRSGLLTKQNFRAPIEDIDPMERTVYGPRYNMVNQSIVQNGGQYSTPSEPHGNYPPAPNMYHNSYGPPQVSQPYENNSTSYAPSAGYNHSTTQYAQSPTVYQAPAPQRVEQYPASSDFRHRYSVVSTASSDGSRAPMPTTTNSGRRSSAFESEDSAIGINLDSRASNEPQYNGNANYFGSNAPREIAPQSNNQIPHKALPVVDRRHSHSVYERPPPVPTPGFQRMSMDSKDTSLWLMNGNASVGHAHYQPQSQWASVTH